MSRTVFLAALVLAAPAWAEARFFGAIEDLPLAPGLEERAGFEFAGAEGRIVEVAAEGAATVAGVRDFYQAALPALGWAFVPGGTALEYARGREQLTVTIAAHEGGARLEARLVVRPASIGGD